ncbi:MAG: branched-chain amino acid ABC transporter permease [Actinomycetota bacterium]|jgi:neutral amino acid transport system permease protein|nr:branched-chain amino acid ABC transporter permease [Actinomycetota bacterium]
MITAVPSVTSRTSRSGQRSTSAVLAALLAFGGVVLLALLGGQAVAGAQEDEPNALAVSGTVRVGRVAVEGVQFVVETDGAVVAEAVTDGDGKWEVVVGGAGVYTVTIDVTSLPEGVSLRDPDMTSREVEIVDRSKAAIFALEGELVGADGSSSTSTPTVDSTFERYLDRAASGVRVGSLVALAAVGLSLIYGVTGLVNFAHAEMVGFGAVVTWTIEDLTGMPLVIAAVIGVLVGGLLGFVLEQGLFAPLRRRRLSLISLMVVSIGLAFLMRYLFLIFFGSDRKFFQDFRIQTNYDIGPFSLPPKDYVIIVLALVVLVAVGLLLQRTKLGTAMRAVADNRDLAESSGIDVRSTILAVWIAGSALASLGGIMLAITQQVSWQMGERQLLLIFAAVTLGGLGTAYGAMVGGLAIGIASEMSTLWLDNDLKFLVALTVLIIILIVRPQGLLGQRERFG